MRLLHSMRGPATGSLHHLLVELRGIAPLTAFCRPCRRGQSRACGGSRWHACDEPSRKSMLQQGGNQAVDCIRAIADNNPILRLGLTQRASVQQERAVADRRDRLSMAVSLIEEMDRQARFRQCGRGAPTWYDHSVIDHRWRVGSCAIDLLGLARGIRNHPGVSGDQFDERLLRHQRILHRLQLLRINAVAAEDGDLPALDRIAGFILAECRRRKVLRLRAQGSRRRRRGRCGILGGADRRNLDSSLGGNRLC